MYDDLPELCEHAIAAACQAGEYIASRWKHDVNVMAKQGGSTVASQVVTEVDLRSQELILAHLKPLCEKHGLGLLTEEGTDDRSRLENDRFWAVDPLDGTLPFVERQTGFSVSIGLVSHSGQPLLGVVYDPVKGRTYSAVTGGGMYRNGQPVSTSLEHAVLTFVCDRSFAKNSRYEETIAIMEEYAVKHEYTGVEIASHGGAVMNACWVTDATPACYMKLPKKEQGGGSIWDFAAMACIAQEAGCVVSDLFGKPLDLNSETSVFFNRSGVLFASNEPLAALCRQLAAPSDDAQD